VTNRFAYIVVIWILLLASAWVAEPYVVALWASATTPRAVTPRANLTEWEETTIRIFQTASPSVVHVFAEESPKAFLFFGPQENVVQSGSGIVWDAAGHVITNDHVVNGTDRIGARLTSGEFVGVRVVGLAPTYDLAVLQLERVRSALHPIAVGRSAGLKVGSRRCSALTIPEVRV
jgi:2-alkenal reductase